MRAVAKAIELLGVDGFARLQHQYTAYGYTYTEPDMLAFARPCREATPFLWLVEGEWADSWWVELAIGKGALPALCDKLPYKLPRIGWQRGFNNRSAPRFYNLDQLLSKI